MTKRKRMIVLRTKLTIAAAAACAVSLAAANDVRLQLDPAHTEVTFTLGDVLHTVHGVFRLKSGEIQFDPDTGKAAGELIVDAASGDSGSRSRDSRMGKNILESARFPEITFTPDHVQGKVSLEGDSQVQVHGMFRIHGAAHELVLPVQVHAAQQRLTASARFNVPYVKWGMKNPSTLFLRVNDQVQIEIKATGRLIGSS